MADKKIKILRLNPDDWAKYKAIRLEALKMEPQAFNSKFSESSSSPESNWRKTLDDKNNIFAFASHKNNIVGLMNITLDEEGVDEDIAVVHGAYVSKNFRGLGVGKKLLEYLIREVRKYKQIKLIKLWVKKSQIPAIRLYENMGFKFTEMAGTNTLIMHRKLSE